ncbi:uncharacterized protein DUF998 [Antricoccus suffuscus]|uniref:Uncharacterized protein DUF998 n=1 Tax=Antricoccus suffuscus TaxID=1629062 RepID=A0A2T0ZZ88_9ACTN|nr:DUF998 domain-containing protein [Antricoccus suffuscus]PRZ41662.1 uncharacterized protein DUF998 [Antricoccus suffuscus]
MLSTTTATASPPVRQLAALSLAGIVVAGIAVAALHFVPPTSRLDPYHETISAYGLSELGWVFNGAVVLLALSSLLLVVALVLDKQLKPLSVGTVMLTLWAVGMAGVAAFEKTNWAIGPSVAGSIHRAASIVAFLALPIGAGWLIGTALRRPVVPGRGLLVAALVFTVSSVVYMGYLVWMVADARSAGAQWWQAIPLGLTERILVVLEVGVLICLALRTARSVTKNPRSVTNVR